MTQQLELFTDCYANTSIVLEQFNVLLKSLPEKEMSADYEPNFDSVISDSKIVSCYKNTDEWKDLYKKIKSLISNVTKQKNSLQKVTNYIPKRIGAVTNVPIVSQNHIDVATEAKSNLVSMVSNVDDLLKEYQLKLKINADEIEPKHPLLRSLFELSAYLKDTLQQIEKLDGENEISMEVSSEEIINQSQDLTATLLLIIQSVYKKHLPQENENIEVINAIDEIIHNGEKVPEETKDILEDKHLKDLLHEKLTTDSKMLQLNSLISKVETLLNNYVQFIASKTDVNQVKSVVMRLVPILEQTVLFVQYFITQKVAVHRVSCKMLSILLKIFSDLATKGFCKPSDLDMDEGEGEGGPGKMTGGTGLGDGEGQKDVSERIENQDQLDDAQRPGEEKKEEDRDCKEEEKGINMTDDFDAHLQDVDKKEGDNSDNEEDNEDADKQMGDIDNAAEKLDQQIWGSEDEEELEDSRKEKEDKGKGESTGEKEMAAKEKEEGTDDGSQGKDKKQKKDINEMEEPEVDDDHPDPYYGKHQEMPEPEDFEMPDNNMDVDGEENDDNDGETETENPFEIDKMKDIPEENETEETQQKEENRNGLDISSDEEGDNEENRDEDGGNDESKKEEDKNEGDENNDGGDVSFSLYYFLFTEF